MKSLSILLRHEIKSLCLSPASYIAAFLFLLVMGSLFQWVIETYIRDAQETLPWVIFFQLFWLPVFFMVPLLTMKSFAEEKRLGTLETLMTTPISVSSIVLSKFLAAYLLYLSLWLITLSFNFILFHYVQDQRILEPGPLLGGVLFTALSGLLFIAIGIFCSSVTRSQLVAGIFSFALLFGLIIGSRYLAEMQRLWVDTSPALRAWVDHVQIFQHAEDLSRGVIDSRAILFYICGAALFLIFSTMTIKSNLWRS